MNSNTRVSGSAIKVLRVIKAMKGHSLHGLSNGELAKGLADYVQDEKPAGAAAQPADAGQTRESRDE